MVDLILKFLSLALQVLRRFELELVFIWSNNRNLHKNVSFDLYYLEKLRHIVTNGLFEVGKESEKYCWISIPFENLKILYFKR